MTRTLTARTPGDLIAVVPIALGFTPADSIVMLTFGPRGSFHARIDMPTTGMDIDIAIDVLRQAAVSNGVQQVVFVAFHDTPDHSFWVLDSLRIAFRTMDIEVIDTLRAHDGLWFQTAEGPGEPYDNSTHAFTAEAAVAGQVIAGSREELASRLNPDTVHAITVPGCAPKDLSDADPEVEARWCHGIVARHVESGQPLGNDDAVHLLLAMSLSSTCRDAALIVSTRETARRAIELWADLVRRAPEDLVADAAAILAFTAWLSGDGATAWIAHDRAVAVNPNHMLAELVAHVLEGALNPATYSPMTLDELLS